MIFLTKIDQKFNSWILKQFWPNSDVKSSFGSVPRRSNLSTQVLADLDGRGGGKPNAAQGSGPAVQNVPKALETAKAFAKSALS